MARARRRVACVGGASMQAARVQSRRACPAASAWSASAPEDARANKTRARVRLSPPLAGPRLAPSLAA